MEDLITPIRERLSGMTQSQRKRLSAVTGVPFHTIQKISIGETLNPRIDTWAKLAAAFGIACAVPREPSFCEDQ
jgi:transcriptional regulator with XRE-family HTH domain